MRLTPALLAPALLTAALLACPALAEEEPGEDEIFENGDWVIETPSTLIIRADGGGNIHDYADRIAALGDKTVRIEGVCKSSCTMFLSHPHTCVAPAASFGFHGPRSNDQSIRNLLELVDKIAAHQPPAIADEFRQTWGLSRDFTWLTGAQVLAMAPDLSACD
jgi:hypothetical protein